MGTNYYLETYTCPHCGLNQEYHIGKSSAGWRFLFDNFKDFETIDELKNFISTRGIIIDEYDRIVKFEEFWNKVEEKQKEKEHKNDELPLYYQIDGYDFMKGEWS